MKTHVLLIKYFTIAFLSYGVDICTFSLLIFGKINLFYSLLIARILSSIFNFICNKWVVYESKIAKNVWNESIKYIILVLINIGLSYEIILFENQILKIPDITAKIIADGFLFFFSFYIQKKFIFKKNKKALP